jgi:hypothetical protein
LLRQADRLRSGLVTEVCRKRSERGGRLTNRAAVERSGTAPALRPVGVAHHPEQALGKCPAPARRRELRSPERQFGVPRRVRSGGEEAVEYAASREDARSECKRSASPRTPVSPPTSDCDLHPRKFPEAAVKVA